MKSPSSKKAKQEQGALIKTLMKSLDALRAQPQPPEQGKAAPLLQVFALYERKRLRGKAYGTMKQFIFSLAHFSRFVGHDPTTADLTDDVVSDFQWHLQESVGIAVDTCRSYVKKLLALWRFACRARLVDLWPEIEVVAAAQRDPVAWTRDELTSIDKAIRSQEGRIGCVPAKDYWLALFYTFWDSAERFTAVTSLRRDDINLKSGFVKFRAENRKGKLKDRTMPLHPQTAAALSKLFEADPGRMLVFEAPCSHDTLRDKWKTMLRDAGLPYDGRHLFHCLRRSVASHWESEGHDATELLDHSMRSVTTRHYLSPEIVKRKRPADSLFRPGEEEK